MTELEILNIPNLYTLRVCAEMHPFAFLTRPRNRPEHNHNYIFASQIHEYPTSTANTGKLYIANTRKKTHSTAEHMRVWNTIPEKIRDISNLKKLKKELKQHLLKQQAEN
jgi:hypothetical protein